MAAATTVAAMKMTSTAAVSGRHARRAQPDLTPFLPVVRAWGLGLLSTTSPAIISILVTLLKGKLSARDASHRLAQTLKTQLRPNKFAAVCAYLIGGATVLPIPALVLLKRLARTRPQLAALYTRLALCIRFCSIFVSAWLSFGFLNRPGSSTAPEPQRSARRKSDVAFAPEGQLPSTRAPPRLDPAGKTFDLTLFGVVRALDICVGSSLSQWRSRSGRPERPSKNQYAASTLFAFSSALVMWNWFYIPDRLPRSYNRWISTAAQCDGRLIEALRQLRFGGFVYGKDTGMAELLGSMCRDYNLPPVWGDPAKSVPIPCELVHSGRGVSCEWHAACQFARGWRFAMNMYLPINLLIQLRRPRAERNVAMAMVEASRSSAFLGMFVALFYYGVCLCRTRLGPNIFSRKTLSPMDIDGGLCVGAGCFLCGWSILLEKPARRQEIAFFVAPRALATLFPRRYDRKDSWREQVAFASSAAVILTAAHANPDRVRGVFGRLLRGLFA